MTPLQGSTVICPRFLGRCPRLSNCAPSGLGRKSAEKRLLTWLKCCESGSSGDTAPGSGHQSPAEADGSGGPVSHRRSDAGELTFWSRVGLGAGTASWWHGHLARGRPRPSLPVGAAGQAYPACPAKPEAKPGAEPKGWPCHVWLATTRSAARREGPCFEYRLAESACCASGTVVTYMRWRW